MAELKGRASERVELNAAPAHVGVATEREHAPPGARGHRGHARVVGVEHGGAVVVERLDELALGGRDRLDILRRLLYIARTRRGTAL